MNDGENRRRDADEDLDAPFLTLLVNFSGVVLAVGGTLAVILAVGSTAHGGDSWIINLLIVLVLVGAHVGLRLRRRQVRHSHQHPSRR